MALPVNVNVVRVRGYWFDQTTSAGYSGGTVTFTPMAADLTDMASFAYIKTQTVVVRPDSVTGYYFADLIATDDPDLTAFAWRVVRTDTAGQVVASATIAVPYTAPTVDVGSGVMKQAIWLVDAATTTVPSPAGTYYTSSQTDAQIADALAGAASRAVAMAIVLGSP